MSVTNRFSRLFKPNVGSDEPSFSPNAGVNPDGVMPMDPAGSMMPMDMSPNGAMGRNNEFAGSMMDERAVLGAQKGDQISVPLLGTRGVAQHQRILTFMLVIALVLLALFTFLTLSQANKAARAVSAMGDSGTQSQRLAKSVSQALVGSAQAFPDVRQSAGVLAKNIRGLKTGDASLNLDPISTDLQEDVDKLLPLVDSAEKNSKIVLDQEKILTQVGSALRAINRQSSDLLEVAETISSLKLQQNAPSAEISASGQLVMLTQRIGKSANEFLTMEGVSPEAVFLLGKDLNSFKEIAQGLLDGSPELRLTASKDAQTRERLDALLKLYEQTRAQAGAILGNLQGLVSAREAQSAIITDSEPLRLQLQGLQDKLSGDSGLGLWH